MYFGINNNKSSSISSFAVNNNARANNNTQAAFTPGNSCENNQPDEKIDIPSKTQVMKIVNNVIRKIDTVEIPEGLDRNLIKASFIEILEKEPPKPEDLAKIDDIESHLLNLAITRAQQKPKVDIKNEVHSAITNLKDFLRKNQNYEFKSPYDDGRTITAGELLQYLNDSPEGGNVIFKAEKEGTARADNINNNMVINTNGQINSQTDLVKILIHEALHRAFNTPQDTQKEEILCETQAMEFTAQMVKSGNLKNEPIKSVFNNSGMTYMDIANGTKKEEYSNLVNSWVNAYYSDRPEDFSGKVSIQGHEILSGDEVYMDGKLIGKIGENIYIDSFNKRDIGLNNTSDHSANRRLAIAENGNLKIIRNGEEIFSANTF